LLGLFEEIEEGTGVASDVVKVEGAESSHPRFSEGGQGEKVRQRF